MAAPVSPPLSAQQLETLRAVGHERFADAGDILYRVGDRRYPFIAILDGEVAIHDATGREFVRHGSAGFLGELSLLTGDPVYVTAVVAKPTRYIAVDREELRKLLFDDSSLAEIVLPNLIARRDALQRQQGLGIEVIGPRTSPATLQMLEYLRRNRLPYRWQEACGDGGDLVLEESELPLVRLPGGTELRAPSIGAVSRALGISLELPDREDVELLVVGAGPAGLGAAVYGASEGLDTLVVEATALGGQAGASRRIENYLGFPSGISGSELTSRAVTQARKFGARTATPYRAADLLAGEDRHLLRLEDEHEISARAVVIATGARYKRLPITGIEEFEGVSVFYAAGPAEGQLAGGNRVAAIGGGNSAGQAAVWLARSGALVTLMHRRRDLRETMSEYLISELERYGVAVRDDSEVVALRGREGKLDSVAMRDGQEVPASLLFLFLGATPCTEWLGAAVTRDRDGFIVTGSGEGGGALETDVPGVFAAGDVRSGSVKRAATAIGEGAMAITLVHRQLARGIASG
jgi:thioredoxin reductase (NADPH)